VFLVLGWRGFQVFVGIVKLEAREAFDTLLSSL
jgi:hypothetical protein